MANEPIEFDTIPGQVGLVASLFPIATPDTAFATGLACTERTNDSGSYTLTAVGPTAGAYKLLVKTASGWTLVKTYVVLLNTTAIKYASDIIAGQVANNSSIISYGDLGSCNDKASTIVTATTAAAIRADVGLGSANLDTQFGVVEALIPDLYHADIQLTKDDANSVDEYTVSWFKNGIVQTSGITVPTIEVIKRADGSDLITSTAMTQIGTTGGYKYDEAMHRVTAGEAVLATVTATIGAATRTFRKVITRDST